MKKAIMFTGILTLITLPVAVGAITLPSGSGTAPSFATTQQTALKIINAALLKLNAAENVIQNNPTLTSSSKTSILSGLNAVEAELMKIKTEVEQATTSAELQAAYDDLNAYIKANKSIVKSSFSLAISEIGASVLAKSQVYKEQVEQLLKVLAVTCPSQSSTITTLTGQITQLQTEMTTLGNAIKSKDTALIKTQVHKLNTLMKSMSVNIKAIQSSCNIPTI